MKKVLKTTLIILLVIFMLAGTSIASIFLTLQLTKPKPKVNATFFDIESTISNIGELNSAMGVYSITDRTDKSIEWFGHKLPFTSSYVTYRYSGKVKAG